MFSQLKQGDVVNRNGECFKILGVCGEVVFFEEDTMVVSRSKRELETQGYRLLEDKKPWVPFIGQTVYRINEIGDTQEYKYDGSSYQQRMVSFSNCFRTREEAILACDKVKELLKSIKEG